MPKHFIAKSRIQIGWSMLQRTMTLVERDCSQSLPAAILSASSANPPDAAEGAGARLSNQKLT